MEREAGSASPGYASGLKRSCGWVTANTGASFSTFSLTTACWTYKPAIHLAQSFKYCGSGFVVGTGNLH
jgi:hypothetical protein